MKTADLLTCASVLEENGCFRSQKELLYFFEKPHKWSAELAELGIILKELDEDNMRENHERYNK